MNKRHRTSKRYLPKELASLDAERYLVRARQYRDQAIKLADMEGFEPNWPKHFLMTHAIVLAISAYLVFERGLVRPHRRDGGKLPEDHDLFALYQEAVRRGLNSNVRVLKELPHLSELHQDSLRALSPS